MKMDRVPATPFLILLGIVKDSWTQLWVTATPLGMEMGVGRERREPAPALPCPARDEESLNAALLGTLDADPTDELSRALDEPWTRPSMSTRRG